MKGIDPLQVVHPAYDRRAIGTAQVGEAFQPLDAQCRYMIVDTIATLLRNDLQLRGEVLLTQLGRTHQVGHDFERDAQPAGGKCLVIDGVVLAGEGVFAGAEFLQYCGKLSGAGLAAAFVDHVLEGMGQAGLTRRFVA
ncbi:hypothetical protein D3C75_904740 [compost metagenome]